MTEEAYNQCVDNHADNLYRFVLKSIKDIDRASDIIQDAFERLWRYKDRIDPTKAKSYLFTTAYHLLIDELNKGKRTVPIETEASVSHYTFNSYSDLSEVLQRANELASISSPDDRPSLASSLLRRINPVSNLSFGNIYDEEGELVAINISADGFELTRRVPSWVNYLR